MRHRVGEVPGQRGKPLRHGYGYRSARLPGAWARRVERVLGADLHEVTADDVRRWVDESLAEDDQLEFKRERYATDDSGRFELAKDVCAFANRSGGVLVIGVAEVKGTAAKAIAMPGVGDPDVRWIQAVLGTWSAPVADVDVGVIQEDGTSDGYLLVVVPPSSRAPHAIHPPGKTDYHWPRRRQSSAEWLSEAEVFDAYRSRAAYAADELARLDTLLGDGVGALSDTYPWLVVALVPAGGAPPGPVTASLIREYEQWLDTVPRSLRDQSFWHYRPATARSRRVVIEPRYGEEKFAAEYDCIELYTDGAGFAGLELREQSPQARAQATIEPLPLNVGVVSDETIAEFVLHALQILSRHARDHGGSWAEATVEVAMVHGGVDQLKSPVALVHYRWADSMQRLDNTRIVRGRPPRAMATVDISSVTEEGRNAVAAAWLAGSGLVNAFGQPELEQFTHNGEIRSQYFRASNLEAVKAWARRNGVAVI